MPLEANVDVLTELTIGFSRSYMTMPFQCCCCAVKIDRYYLLIVGDKKFPIYLINSFNPLDGNHQCFIAKRGGKNRPLLLSDKRSNS